MESNSAPPITEFDKITTNNSTLMMKALIPFMEPQIQKSLSIMIRVQEFQQTISYFNSPVHQMSVQASQDEMMETILQYAAPDARNMMSNMKNVMNMTNAFKMYSDMEQNPAFQDIFNKMNGAASGEEFSNEGNPADQKEDYESENYSYADNYTGDEAGEYNNGLNEYEDLTNSEQNNNNSSSVSHNNSQVHSSFSETDKMLNSFMNSEQKEKYEEFMNQLNDVTF